MWWHISEYGSEARGCTVVFVYFEEEVNRRFEVENIQGITLKYRLNGNVVCINELPRNEFCFETFFFEILYVVDWIIFGNSMKELQIMLNKIIEVVEVFLQR